MSEARGAAAADPAPCRRRGRRRAAARLRDRRPSGPRGARAPRSCARCRAPAASPRSSRRCAASGPKLAASAADAEIATLGDLLLRLPHSYRDRADVAEAAELKIGERATLMVEVRTPARLRPTRRRNLKIVEATVADHSGPLKATWFNQAWLADKLVPGARLLIAGKLDRSGFRVETYELLGRAGGAPEGLHTTGIVPVHPATERLRAQKVREWAWQVRGLAADAIEPLPGTGPRPPRAARRRRRARRRPLPGVADRGRAGARAPRLRGAGPAPGRARAAALRAPREPPRHSARAVGRPRRRVGRVAAVRADRRPARRDRRDRRRPRLGSPDAAPADGRGRLGQDGRRARGDAALRRERRPGGADGADRDARRAALRDARDAARRHRRRPFASSAARPRPRAAARCSATSRAGRPSSSSARTR